jgi:hypothetical protein
MHEDCAECEGCAEDAIIHAKATGSGQATMRGIATRSTDPQATPHITHEATVKRCICSGKEYQVYPGMDGQQHTDRCPIALGNARDIEA